MSKPKFTKGPWIAGDDEDSDASLVGPETWPGIVTRPVAKLHDEHDAFLLAAAPDLYEALEILVEDREAASIEPELDAELQKAELALAKARGEHE